MGTPWTLVDSLRGLAGLTDIRSSFTARLHPQATAGRRSAARAHAARSLLVADVEGVRADLQSAASCQGCLFRERFDGAARSRRPFPPQARLAAPGTEVALRSGGAGCPAGSCHKLSCEATSRRRLPAWPGGRHRRKYSVPGTRYRPLQDGGTARRGDSHGRSSFAPVVIPLVVTPALAFWVIMACYAADDPVHEPERPVAGQAGAAGEPALRSWTRAGVLAAPARAACGRAGAAQRTRLHTS